MVQSCLSRFHSYKAMFPMSAIQVPHAFHMECMNHFTLRTLGPVTFAHSMMGHHLPTLTFPETPSISSTLRSWHRTPSVTQTRSPPTHMPQKRMESGLSMVPQRMAASHTRHRAISSFSKNCLLHLFLTLHSVLL